MTALHLPQEKLDKISSSLNELLATYQVFYVVLQNFHWNVRGHAFFELHEKLEDMYNDTFEKIDEIAERIVSFNNKPYGSLAEFVQNSKIQEHSSTPDAETMITEVLERLSAIIGLLRDDIQLCMDNHDEGTADKLIAHIQDYEKNYWMLSAWLNK